jgi:S1-C subfamily serine protease
MLVKPGSPADHSGWKEGTEVLAINGQKIDAKFSGSALSHWSEQPPGTIVTLTLADGSTRQLMLADYY